MPSPIKILADASLPGLTDLFSPPFSLTLYQNQQQVANLLPGHNVLLCRSTLNVNTALLANSDVQCIATASSGTDHIDNNYLNQRNIALIDAKGCNARAVADYVVATIGALHSGGKSSGKRAGVIGVGEVGSRVVTRLRAAGFDVACFDPLKASQDKNYPYVSLADLTTCDLLCIHANLHETPPYPSRGLLNADFLSQLKAGTIIINAARGGIIDEEALLSLTTPITYCTDVYIGEPAINPRIIDFATLCTPHIAGHSIEAKYAALVEVSKKLHLHYGLLASVSAAPTALLPDRRYDTIAPWEQCVLDLYNPQLETCILKAAADKKAAFLTLRQAHLSRHDFNVYNLAGINQQIRSLLGF